MTREPSGGTGGDYSHSPVMLEEIVELCAVTPAGVILDATVGGGGHAASMLAASSRHRLIGIDRDAEAVAAARRRLEPFGARAVVVKERFDRLGAVLAELAPGQPLACVLFDLGVSSRQFDAVERGFSYRLDGPLDMRMDRSQPLTAADVVNDSTEAELVELFSEHGEGRFARRIARAVIAGRPVTSTVQLADIVRSAIPAAVRPRSGHPARRVFQALRVAVNGELELLGPALDEAMALLVPGGRCIVLAYHSGEDRLVKDHFAAAAAGWCRCPPGLPCVCGAVPAVRLLTRGARLPGAGEVAANPRASSARLRSVERLDVPFRKDGSVGSPRARDEEEG